VVIVTAKEHSNWIHYVGRKTEGNCFTDTTDAPGICDLSANQCHRSALETTLARFAPFDGDKGRAMDWLAADTWRPPADASDVTALWEERFALTVFYYATSGDGWNNNNGWLTVASVCSWNGITGCNEDDSVTKFELCEYLCLRLMPPLSRCIVISNSTTGNDGYPFGLVGDFPDELRVLTNLEHFKFSKNSLVSSRYVVLLLSTSSDFVNVVVNSIQ